MHARCEVGPNLPCPVAERAASTVANCFLTRLGVNSAPFQPSEREKPSSSPSSSTGQERDLSIRQCVDSGLDTVNYSRSRSWPSSLCQHRHSAQESSGRGQNPGFAPTHTRIISCKIISFRQDLIHTARANPGSETRQGEQGKGASQHPLRSSPIVSLR